MYVHIELEVGTWISEQINFILSQCKAVLKICRVRLQLAPATCNTVPGILFLWNGGARQILTYLIRVK